MAHKHETCQHELAYCAECRVVHCRRCHKEWGETAPIVVSPFPYYPSPWPGYPFRYGNPVETGDALPPTVTTWS